MIMRGNTPRSLTWPGYLAVIALGLTILPMLPSLHGEPPSKDEVKKLSDLQQEAQRFRDQAKAEVEHQKARIAKKQAELQKAEAELKAAEAQAREFEKQARIRTELRDLAKKEEATLAAREKKAIYRIEITFPTDKLPGDPTEMMRKIVKVLPKGHKMVFSGPHPVVAVPVRQSDEQRINDLEKKLEKVLQELHDLRKQLKESRSGVEFSPAPNRIAPRNSLLRP